MKNDALERQKEDVLWLIYGMLCYSEKHFIVFEIVATYPKGAAGTPKGETNNRHKF